MHSQYNCRVAGKVTVDLMGLVERPRLQQDLRPANAQSVTSLSSALSVTTVCDVAN